MVSRNKADLHPVSWNAQSTIEWWNNRASKAIPEQTVDPCWAYRRSQTQSLCYDDERGFL